MAHLRGIDRTKYVTQMFARISARYDLLNTIMTGGMHYVWRRRASRMAIGNLSGPALDIATGTGDFAFDLIREPSVSQVVGLDYTPEMVSIAKMKAVKHHVSPNSMFVIGDALALPFADDSFICATVGFGIRNFIDVPQALREMTRVVRPYGRIVILEIVRFTDNGLWSKLFPFYFRYVTPSLGAIVAGNREAYTYLPESVMEFLKAEEIASIMEGSGLQNVSYYKLGLGAVAILTGEKRP